MNKISENAIIIIGNGFDLAHGLNTSYNDFASWYVNNVITKEIYNVLYSSNSVNEETLSLLKKTVIETVKTGRSGYVVSEIIYNIRRKAYNLDEIDRIDIISKELNKDLSIIQHIINNKFFGNLYADKYDNWFDIENTYFHELTEILKLEKTSKDTKNELNRLNTEFNQIKKLLNLYLSSIETKKSEEVKYFFKENFIGKRNVTFVNFNYTDTIKHYINDFIYSHSLVDNKVKTTSNFIHGKLNSNIIFGYGDDDSEEYLEMKKTKKDEYLENFKTFHYLEDNQYRKLMNLIFNIEDYEIYILGHSLSLTDKTLLFEILSPQKCKNIHLFKRTDLELEGDKIKDIKKLHFNISRILNNDADSRKKIIPITNTPHFPFNQKLDNSIINEKYISIYNQDLRDFDKPKQYLF